MWPWNGSLTFTMDLEFEDFDQVRPLACSSLILQQEEGMKTRKQLQKSIKRIAQERAKAEAPKDFLSYQKAIDEDLADILTVAAERVDRHSQRSGPFPEEAHSNHTRGQNTATPAKEGADCQLCSKILKEEGTNGRSIDQEPFAADAKPGSTPRV